MINSLSREVRGMTVVPEKWERCLLRTAKVGTMSQFMAVGGILILIFAVFSETVPRGTIRLIPAFRPDCST
jgi:hypothetical protein